MLVLFWKATANSDTQRHTTQAALDGFGFVKIQFYPISTLVFLLHWKKYISILNFSVKIFPTPANSYGLHVSASSCSSAIEPALSNWVWPSGRRCTLYLKVRNSQSQNASIRGLVLKINSKNYDKITSGICKEKKNAFHVKLR